MSTRIPEVDRFLAAGRSRIAELDSMIEAEVPEPERRGRPKDIHTKHRTREERLEALAQDFREVNIASANRTGRWWIDGTWNLFQPKHT